MPTSNQLIKKHRKKKKVYKPVPALINAPFRKGICIKVFTRKPKKPNSAQRKIARVRIDYNTIVSVTIPGQGHNLQEHSVVLVRGGRAKDVPGVRYKLVKGKYDFNYMERIPRKKRRSKFGWKKDF